MADLHVGTSGWSYKHWKDVFYPPDVKPTRWLEYYVTQFDCVELNASFYRLPQAKTVEDWQKRTPDHFKFCFKLSRYITQLKKFRDAEEPLQTFFERFDPLKKCAGPVLVQLPPNFGFDPERSEQFYELLKQYKPYRFALEARHKSWFSDESLALLRKYKIALVVSDSGNKFTLKEAVTTDFMYLRFHGREALYASDYSNQVLEEYANKIKRWLEQGCDVWAFFNNDGFAYAIKNARELRALVQD